MMTTNNKTTNSACLPSQSSSYAGLVSMGATPEDIKAILGSALKSDSQLFHLAALYSELTQIQDDVEEVWVTFINLEGVTIGSSPSYTGSKQEILKKLIRDARDFFPFNRINHDRLSLIIITDKD